MGVHKGEGIGMFTVQKRPFYRNVSTRLSFIVAMITVHFNYAKRRFDILKLLSMLDGRIGRRKPVERVKYGA